MAHLQFDDVRIEDFNFGDFIKSIKDSGWLVPTIELTLSVRDKDAEAKFLKYLNLARDQQLNNKNAHMAIGFQTYIPNELVDCEHPWGITPADKCNPYLYPEVNHIFYDDIATVVFWKDGTKTVVKCPEGKPYDEYSAFCAALAKKIYGNNSKLQREIKKKAKDSKKRWFLKESLGDNYVRNGEAFVEGPKHD